jgi:anti-sigma28 factor (negative regulator of flagellin synthesis)
MSEVMAMKNETWNSWTCPGMDDVMGRPMEGYAGDAADGRRVWRRRARKPWLERAFQASLKEALEQSMPVESRDRVRMELVERIRADIAKGTYQIAAGDLAEKLIQTMRGGEI